MKKVLFKIGLMLIFSALFIGCGGNGGNPDSGKGGVKHFSIDESDITENLSDSEDIVLEDGNYKFIHVQTFFSNSKDSGKCTVSVSEEKITFLEVIEESDGLIMKATTDDLRIMNNTDYYGNFLTRLNNNKDNWVIKNKANQDFSKMTAVSDTETIILEKID